jgi:uncharacterized protein YndB with AHSA1/START domain
VSDPGRISVDEFLPHPPARVWRALVDPGELARWLMPNDFRPVVGHRFTLIGKPIEATGFSGTVHCEVLDIEPERMLRISWSDPEGSELDTVVTWTLEAEGRGTRLFLEHSGFDPDDPVQQMALRIMDSGWSSHVLRRLHVFLDS